MKKIKLLYKKYKEIINYIIVGGMTTVVGLGIYYILVISVLDPLKPVELQIANICSWIGAVAFAYFTNRKFVFESQNQNKVKEASNLQAPNSKKTEISIINNQKEKKNWFQANELEDGYQFGDISKTILGTGTDIVQDLATGILSPIENGYWYKRSSYCAKYFRV